MASSFLGINSLLEVVMESLLTNSLTVHHFGSSCEVCDQVGMENQSLCAVVAMRVVVSETNGLLSHNATNVQNKARSEKIKLKVM